jgi:hypothetical protein
MQEAVELQCFLHKEVMVETIPPMVEETTTGARAVGAKTLLVKIAKCLLRVAMAVLVYPTQSLVVLLSSMRAAVAVAVHHQAQVVQAAAVKEALQEPLVLPTLVAVVAVVLVVHLLDLLVVSDM